MAKAGPAQNQTVEEILASIRQAITEDESRKREERFAPVRPLADDDDEGGEAAASEAEEHAVVAPASAGDDTRSAAGAGEESDPRMREMIDLAIEQALAGVRAELEGSAPAEAPAPAVPEKRPAPRLQAPTGTRSLARREVLRQPRPLLSTRQGAAVSASFDDLTRAMPDNARDVEDVVEEMLRPMLQAWLDDNLPQMVERLVREEIERVSRGRRQPQPPRRRG
jgi:hypothetical protein